MCLTCDPRAFARSTMCSRNPFSSVFRILKFDKELHATPVHYSFQRIKLSSSFTRRFYLVRTEGFHQNVLVTPGATFLFISN